LAVVFFAEGALDEEEDREVVGGEVVVGFGEDEEALVEHELNPAGDFVRLVVEPSSSPSGDGRVKDEEAAKFDGSVFVVFGSPVAGEEVLEFGLEGDEHLTHTGVLEGGEKFGGDFLSDEEGGELEDGVVGNHEMTVRLRIESDSVRSEVAEDAEWSPKVGWTF
jgi:hypothetical protein